MARKKNVPVPRRVRGEGSISQQKSGLWIGQIYVGSGDNRQRRSVSGESREQVAEKLRQLQEDATKVDLTRTRGELAALLDEWFGTLREDGQGGDYSPTTLRSYRGIIENHLKPRMGHLTLDQLGGRDGPAHVAALMDALAGSVSDQTRRNIRNCLGSCLTWAGYRHRILANPVRNVKAPPASRFRGQILKRDQSAELRDAFRGHPLEAALVIIFNYGLRRAEALGLQWHNVYLDDPVQPYVKIDYTMHRLPGRGRVLIEPKNEHSRRNIPLNPELVQLFRERQRTQSEQEEAWSGDRWNNADNLVFTAPEGHGQGVGPDEFSKLVVALLVAAGIRRPGEKGFRLHDLRHNAISDILRRGTPISLAQSIAGHKNLATTSRYTHVNLEDMTRVAALFN